MTVNLPVGPASPNIDGVIAEFLNEQAQRLSTKTLSRYWHVLDLFRIYLDGYWPGEGQAYDRITKQGGSYCTWFAPDRIPGGYSEFLGYYMAHKVMNGMETKRAAGTVMKKFAEWLESKGYIQSAASAVERSKRASRELPGAEAACRLLVAWTSGTPRDQTSKEIEDHFTVVRVQPGTVWLSPLCGGPRTTLGPIQVPSQATKILAVSWDISGIVGRTSRGWRLIEVWNVSA